LYNYLPNNTVVFALCSNAYGSLWNKNADLGVLNIAMTLPLLLLWLLVERPPDGF
jgi:hypothetical protein